MQKFPYIVLLMMRGEDLLISPKIFSIDYKKQFQTWTWI